MYIISTYYNLLVEAKDGNERAHRSEVEITYINSNLKLKLYRQTFALSYYRRYRGKTRAIQLARENVISYRCIHSIQ